MREITFDEPFTLKNGEQLAQLTLAYETYGHLSDRRDNVVVVHHSLGTSAHVAASEENPEKGWWHALVGPNLAIDTTRYFVICINNLGSCYGSSGPTTIDKLTGKPYRNLFPQISIEDMVVSQKKLLDHLGISKVYAVIGGSMGGMLSVCWGHLYPHHVKNIIAISTCHKAYPLQLAYRACQREAIRLDPNWQDGAYEKNPVDGLKTARMISHLLYRGFEEVDRRFSENHPLESLIENSQVNRYYHYNSDKFARQFDANSYIQLLNAMDYFNLETYGQDLFKSLTASVLIIATDTDVLYPPRQQQALAQLFKAQGVNVTFIEHASRHGHDAFLVEGEAMGKYIQSFFAQS